MIIAFPGSILYKNARLNGRIPDPIQFLHDGCPIINLSTEMSDGEYLKLVQDVSHYNHIQYNIHDYKMGGR